MANMSRRYVRTMQEDARRVALVGQFGTEFSEDSQVPIGRVGGVGSCGQQAKDNDRQVVAGLSSLATMKMLDVEGHR